MTETIDSPSTVGAPGIRNLLLENRLGLEVGALLAAEPWLARIGRGDGHPVLVLPGFTTSDVATVLLRMHLRSWGYWVHGWRLGFNIGPTAATVDGLRRRLDAVYLRHGQPVTLIGWSLGGVYARQLAREFPDQVRSVITLASPYRMNLQDRSSLSGVVDRLAGTFDPDISERLLVREQDRPAIGVPTTSIYSRTDGVVRWHTCIDASSADGDARRENIEVTGSHTGMVVHPSVMFAVADRLRQPVGAWSPFRPPRRLQGWYPEPADWQPAAVRREARRAEVRPT